jgi:hypothetical protein
MSHANRTQGSEATRGAITGRNIVTYKCMAPVYPSAMVEIAKNPDQYNLPNSGKSVDHIAWYDVGRGPTADKEVMDVVTDDGSIYRWTRFPMDEKWTFETRVRPDGSRDTASRPLPSKLNTLVDRSDDVLYA